MGTESLLNVLAIYPCGHMATQEWVSYLVLLAQEKIKIQSTSTERIQLSYHHEVEKS